MNPKNWQEKRKLKRDLKYIGYKIRYNTFTWDNVIRVTDVYVNTQDPEKVLAYYEIHFTNGQPLVVSEFLETRTEEKKGVFYGTNIVSLTTSQPYFDKPCEVLQEIRQSRKDTVKAFFNFKRYTLKK